MFSKADRIRIIEDAKASGLAGTDLHDMGIVIAAATNDLRLFDVHRGRGNVRARGDMPILVAALNGHAVMVDVLLSAGAVATRNAMLAAEIGDHLDIIAMLTRAAERGLVESP